MARRLSMTGEIVDARRAERIGLVTEVVAHERMLTRAVELATQIAEVAAPIMAGLKQIYATGSTAVTNPALPPNRPSPLRCRTPRISARGSPRAANATVGRFAADSRAGHSWASQCNYCILL